MREALTGIDCWVSGIRREDSSTRAGAAKFGWDKRFGLWKLNPLADWTEADVWDYINEHEIPYNPLHDAGYPSIGCTHCTRPPGADAGRKLRPLGGRPQDRVWPAWVNDMGGGAHARQAPGYGETQRGSACRTCAPPPFHFPLTARCPRPRLPTKVGW